MGNTVWLVPDSMHLANRRYPVGFLGMVPGNRDLIPAPCLDLLFLVVSQVIEDFPGEINQAPVLLPGPLTLWQKK